MIWATLAFLAVPIWLVVGALIGAPFSRQHFMAQPDVVALTFRANDDDKWPRGRAYGRYVLIVNHGLAQIRTRRTLWNMSTASISATRRSSTSTTRSPSRSGSTTVRVRARDRTRGQPRFGYRPNSKHLAAAKVLRRYRVLVSGVAELGAGLSADLSAPGGCDG
jgi:hypothetical protein